MLFELPLDILSGHVLGALDPRSCWSLALASKDLAHMVADLDQAHGRLPAFVKADTAGFDQDLPRSLGADAVVSVRCSCTRICGRWSLFTRDMTFEIRSLLVDLTVPFSIRALVGFAQCGKQGPVRVMAKRMYTGEFWVTPDHSADLFMACVPYDDFEANVFLDLELFALHGGDLPVYVGRL